MGTWLKHDVITVVNAPLENVWDTWSDLDSMSLWMSWIASVKTVDEETNKLPDLTEWTLAANGFRFKWKAQITERVEKSKLKWKSIGGLPTEGSVVFESKTDQIKLLTIGPQTTKICNKIFGRVDRQAQKYTFEGLLDVAINIFN